MKILVISDTHGELGKFYEVYRGIDKVDIVVHLGDYEQDALDIGKNIDAEVKFVKGNMDGAMTKEDSSDFLKTEAGVFLLTHGHVDGVNIDINNLVYRAKEQECRGVLFGHTHRAYMENLDDFLILNPGSITKPRDGSDGSYAIVTILGEKVDSEIIYYKKPYKAKGGYIKGLMNYSDRF